MYIPVASSITVGGNPTAFKGSIRVALRPTYNSLIYLTLLMNVLCTAGRAGCPLANVACHRLRYRTNRRGQYPCCQKLLTWCFSPPTPHRRLADNQIQRHPASTCVFRKQNKAAILVNKLIKRLGSLRSKQWGDKWPAVGCTRGSEQTTMQRQILKIRL
jgi:hypothetical protein